MAPFVSTPHTVSCTHSYPYCDGAFLTRPESCTTMRCMGTEAERLKFLEDEIVELRRRLEIVSLALEAVRTAPVARRPKPVGMTGSRTKPTALRHLVARALREAAGEPLHSKKIWALIEPMGAMSQARKKQSVVDLTAHSLVREGYPVAKAGPSTWRWTGDK